MRAASWTPLPWKSPPTWVASEAWSPMRTGGAKPCVERCSASRRWIAIAAATARSGESKLTKKPSPVVEISSPRWAANTSRRAVLCQRSSVVPRLVAERLDEVRRADDVGEHERLHDASRRTRLAAQLPGQELGDVLEDDGRGRAGERGGAQDLLVDAVGTDDVGLAVVAGEPVERGRREA